MKHIWNAARILSFLAVLAVLLTFGGVLGLPASAEGTTTTEGDWIPADEYIGKQPGTDYAYSFAVLGDTQNLNLAKVNGKSDDFTKLYDWIIANAEDKRIARVIGLGDITDATLIKEYDNAKAEFAKLEAVGIPYSFVRGNHDATTEAQVEQYTTARKDADGNRFTPDQGIKFQDAFTWEEFGHIVDGSFSNDMINTYSKFEVGEVKYLILNIDYGPSDEVVAWMNQVISENSDRYVIIATHIYLDPEGGFSGTAGYDGLKSADKLWDACIKRHENIVMVLSGHYETDIVVREDLGVYKNKVTSILIDPQGVDKNELAATGEGAGLVAMFYFSEDGKMLDVEYYSTIKDAYYKESNQISDLKIVLDESEKETTTYVSTEAELKVALVNGGDITLTNDIEFTSISNGRILLNPIAPLILRSGEGGPFTLKISDSLKDSGYTGRFFLTNAGVQTITLLDVIFDGNNAASTVNGSFFQMNGNTSTSATLNLGSPDEPGKYPEFKNFNTAGYGTIFANTNNVVNVYGAYFHDNTATTASSSAIYLNKSYLNVYGTLITEAASITGKSTTVILDKGAEVLLGVMDSASFTEAMAMEAVD